MGDKLIVDLREGERIEGQYMIRELKLTPFRGKPGNFLSITMGDRTGTLDAKVWENAEKVASKLKAGLVIKVEGMVNSYRDQLQLKIDKLEKVKGEIRAEDFMESSPRDPEEMKSALKEMIASIRNPHLEKLLKGFFSDTGFLDAFFKAPAAKKMHQAYLGGLLEHSLNVAAVAHSLSEVYGFVDRDLLITGALLHDIGKVDEYDYSTNIDYTLKGRLLGHIVMGAEMVGEKMEAIQDFPEELKLKMVHMIISHHGQYEWQSPKRPKFLEAMLLHQADYLDSHICYFHEYQGEGIVFSKPLGRYIYSGEKEAAVGKEHDKKDK